MKTGWTGGQYSIYRALLALSTGCVLASRLTIPLPDGPITAFLGLALLGCAALAMGWHDWIAAAVLMVFGMGAAALVDGAPLDLPRVDVVMIAILLALHIATPPDPFGAWSARGRPDPGGPWCMPEWIPNLAWGILAAAYLFTDIERLANVELSPLAIDAIAIVVFGLLFDLWFAVALIRTKSRGSAWIAMSLWKIACMFAFGNAGTLGALGAFGLPVGSAPLWLFHALAFDARWLPGRTGQTAQTLVETNRTHDAIPVHARLFYDGDCGLCHRTIRFLLAEEGNLDEDSRLRFAPIGGDAFERMLVNSPSVEANALPDSIFLKLEDGRILTKSAAVSEIANRLGGVWRAIAFVLTFGERIPHSALDYAYDIVADHRKRFFAKPTDSCPILPPDLRARFDL